MQTGRTMITKSCDGLHVNRVRIAKWSPSASPSNRRCLQLNLFSPSVARDPMHAFVDRFQDLEARGSVSEILELYAPIVTYFDDGRVDRKFIEKDKQDYRSRWINRTESRSGDISIDRSGETWTLTYPTHFRVDNSEGYVDRKQMPTNSARNLAAYGSSLSNQGPTGAGKKPRQGRIPNCVDYHSTDYVCRTRCPVSSISSWSWKNHSS